MQLQIFTGEGKAVVHADLLLAEYRIASFSAGIASGVSSEASCYILYAINLEPFMSPVHSYT